MLLADYILHLPFIPSSSPLIWVGQHTQKPFLKEAKNYIKIKSLVVVVESLSCVQLFWDPADYGPPGSSVHGILQARIQEWTAISFSRGSFQPRV